MYDENNIFAKILRGEIPSKQIYENEFAFAFHDIFPKAAVHALVIPKGAFKNFPDFVANETPEKISNFFKKVSEIATLLAADKSGFRLISNIGSDAHQTVPHFHVHILAGKKMGPLISSDNQLR